MSFSPPLECSTSHDTTELPPRAPPLFCPYPNFAPPWRNFCIQPWLVNLDTFSFYIGIHNDGYLRCYYQIKIIMTPENPRIAHDSHMELDQGPWFITCKLHGMLSYSTIESFQQSSQICLCEDGNWLMSLLIGPTYVD